MVLCFLLKMIASGSYGTNIKIWNSITYETIKTLEIGGAIYDVCFSPDGNLLLEANDTGYSDDYDDYDIDGNYVGVAVAMYGIKIFNVYDDFSINRSLKLEYNIKKICFSYYVRIQQL